tara:strand:+ start:104 stop:538 length:435 start_codon:yes stop_codon:yes gene_type:complete
MAEGLSVALPLNINSVDGAYALHKDLAAMANQNLKMVVLTNPGERIMQPDFGAGIRQLLFEPANANTVEDVKNRIQTQVNRYLPYINLIELNVFVSETDAATLAVSLKYSIPAANIVSDLVIDVGSGASTSAGAGTGGGGGGGY